MASGHQECGLKNPYSGSASSMFPSSRSSGRGYTRLAVYST